MNKSELFEKIAKKKTNISGKIIGKIIKKMLEHMVLALSDGRRIEIRGFGSFTLRYRKPRFGRNPKNGNLVHLQEKYIPHFKPGKQLRDRTNFLKLNFKRD